MSHWVSGLQLSTRRMQGLEDKVLMEGGVPLVGRAVAVVWPCPAITRRQRDTVEWFAEQSGPVALKSPQSPERNEPRGSNSQTRLLNRLKSFGSRQPICVRTYFRRLNHVAVINTFQLQPPGEVICTPNPEAGGMLAE